MLKFFRQFSIRNLSNEVRAYGYTYSFKNYLLSVFMILVCTIGGGIFYKLQWPFIAAICVACLLCLPLIVRSQFLFMYEQLRFSQVDSYLHQMVVSFRRDAKISLALEDTYKIATGRLKIVIREALEMLSTSGTESVYEEALAIIDKEYPCARIETLHKYLISVEDKGGKFNHALDILLVDFDRWIKRTYREQDKLIKHKRDAALGILICFFVAAISVFISYIVGGTLDGINMDITGDSTYQYISTGFFFACIFYYTRVQIHTKADWIGRVRTDERIEKDFKLAFDTDVNHVRLVSIPIYIVFVLIGVGCFFIGKTPLAELIGESLGPVFGVIFLVFTFIIFLEPDLSKKVAMGNIREDCYDGFSEWLRDVSINLQDAPLQVAIEESYDTCPIVFKKSLEKFIKAINENPCDNRPYNDFLSEFGIVDISSTVQTLYSYTDLDDDKVDITVNELILKNYDIVDNHQEIKDKDAESIRFFSNYIPTAFIALKVSVDMVLILSTYM